jgi:hypothetical protein
MKSRSKIFLFGIFGCIFIRNFKSFQKYFFLAFLLSFKTIKEITGALVVERLIVKIRFSIIIRQSMKIGEARKRNE